MYSLLVLLMLRRGITIVMCEIRKGRVVKWLLLGMVRVMLLRRLVIISQMLLLQWSNKLILRLLYWKLKILMMIMVRIHILWGWNSQWEIYCFCTPLILIFLIKQLLLLVMLIDEASCSNTVLKIFKILMKILLLVIILYLMSIIHLLIYRLKVLLLLKNFFLYLKRIFIILLSLVLR